MCSRIYYLHFVVLCENLNLETTKGTIPQIIFFGKDEGQRKSSPQNEMHYLHNCEWEK
jgi:hypothetical protein